MSELFNMNVKNINNYVSKKIDQDKDTEELILFRKKCCLAINKNIIKCHLNKFS